MFVIGGESKTGRPSTDDEPRGLGSDGSGGSWEEAPPTICLRDGVPAGTLPLPLEREVVEVWRIEVSEANLGWAQAADCLSPEEVGRAARYRFAADRDRFVLGRSALRRRLAAGLRCAAGDVRIQYGAQGRPELESGSNPAGVVFSVSHIPGLVLLAFARGCRLGIDVETVDRVRDWRSFARLALSEREYAAVASLPAGLQAAGFLRAWTAKEAYLKATGRGLTVELGRIEAEVDPARPARLLKAYEGDGEPADWKLRSIAVGRGAGGDAGVGAGGRLGGDDPRGVAAVTCLLSAACGGMVERRSPAPTP
ncbi:MAG: 4'-phosphopantetheinyl transferase superfamily protein [Verrucomicrobia bacterium]|nr:4'-phosphopantetheinyl transferase superfamily protein [Verrucomicrobiota bacterium]